MRTLLFVPLTVLGTVAACLALPLFISAAPRQEAIGEYVLTTQRQGYLYDVTLEQYAESPETVEPDEIPGLNSFQSRFSGNRARLSLAEVGAIRTQLFWLRDHHVHVD